MCLEQFTLLRYKTSRMYQMFNKSHIRSQNLVICMYTYLILAMCTEKFKYNKSKPFLLEEYQQFHENGSSSNFHRRIGGEKYIFIYFNVMLEQIISKVS